MPTISPERTLSDSASSAVTPRSSTTVRSRAESTSSPGWARVWLIRSNTSRPTIMVAMSALVRSAAGRVAIVRPSRITVTTSAMASTSSSLCEMNSTAQPFLASSRTTTNKSSTSLGVSTAVGSSRISSRVSWLRALSTSTRCLSPTDRFSTRSVGCRASPNCFDSFSTSDSMAAVSRLPERVMISRPRNTLAATVNDGTSLKCWYTMPMPSRAARWGLVMATTLSSTRISPSSGFAVPAIIVMSVVLPAPFSPTRAWILPASTARLIRSLATSEPYFFVMLRSSSRAMGTDLYSWIRTGVWGRLARRPHTPRGDQPRVVGTVTSPLTTFAA